MKTFLIFILIIFSSVAFSQTKIIAHKSHSGSSKHFSKLLKKKGSSATNGNFGLPGNQNIILLDSVIAVNDSITVLKIRESNVCYPYYEMPNYKKLDDSDFKYKTDTLVNNSIWNKNNSEVFIRNAEGSRNELRIWFENPFSEVVLIGFKKD